MGTPASPIPPRNLGLDLLRVLAAYMVMQIHAGEFEYIGAGGVVLHTPAAWAVGWLNSLFRVCVPLFVMIAGFFLFPVGDEAKFFRKRFTRVLIPFLLWCVLYALYYYARGEATFAATLRNIGNIPVNYGTDVGHLWFVYMLLGIYLIAPVLSPWVVSASRGSMELFLALWVVASSLPYIHLVVPAIWGEAYWDATPLLYYFSGFIGYVVLAAYLRRFWMAPSRRVDAVAVSMVVAGYAWTAGGFLHRLAFERMTSDLELTWNFTTLNVALMTAGLFLLFRNVHVDGDTRLWRLVDDLSKKSYGMYLGHIMVLNAVHALLAPHVANAFLRVPLTAMMTFVMTYVAMRLISLLPKSRYLLG